jgi:hypothetical protein
VRHSLADIDKARRRLGYAPGHRLGDGLAEVMDWSVEDLGGDQARELINPGRFIARWKYRHRGVLVEPENSGLPRFSLNLALNGSPHGETRRHCTAGRRHFSRPDAASVTVFPLRLFGFLMRFRHD